MQSRQLILIALYAPHSTCQLFQMAKAFREVKTVCMHLLSSKETATPIWHLQGLKNLLRADTRTHTFSQSPYLANRIWQIGKQTVLGTDWRTDRQTHAAQTDRANIQTAICTHSKTEGGLPLVPTCARALCAKLKMWLCVCFIFFFFFLRVNLPLQLCNCHLNKSKLLCLLHFLSSVLTFPVMSTHPAPLTGPLLSFY